VNYRRQPTRNGRRPRYWLIRTAPSHIRGVQGNSDVASLQVFRNDLGTVIRLLELGHAVIANSRRVTLINQPAHIFIAVQTGRVITLGCPGDPLVIVAKEE